MEANISLNEMVLRAQAAQKVFEEFDQAMVDKVVYVIGKIVYDNAKPFAKMEFEETRMGVYEDKIAKNIGKSRMIWNSLKGKKSMGLLRHIPEDGIMEFARPMGVVGAVTPCTNAIPTCMGNSMMALKCRNAIIIAPHPRAKKCCAHYIDMVNEELLKLGAPRHLIQIIREPSVALTKEVMSVCDISVATGGGAMVKAAYSSGKPAYGVGVGNVQCIIDRGYDFKVAVPKIIFGRKFDNGIICSAEQTVILPRSNYDEIIAEFKAQGAYYADGPEEIEKFRKAVFGEGGILNKDLVGQSVQAVAKAAGVPVPDAAQVIILKAAGTGDKDFLSKEKMCPVLSAYAYDSFDDALNIALDNLNHEGRGHSVSIHSDKNENLIKAGEILPVSRILINQICATMNGGAFTNGLAPTTSLGCGSWGGNSITENLDYKHFYNVARVASEIPGRTAPADDVIWEVV